MTTADQFAAAAESLLGAPFHHLGRTGAGLDCIGLTYAAAAKVGVIIAPFDTYQPQPDPDVLMRAVRERCDLATWGERLLRGRLLVLRQKSGGEPKHFAVTLGGGMVAHVGRTRSARLRVADEFIHSVWRVRGIDYGEAEPWR